MNTGIIQNWTGNMADYGPIYPFVGSEVFWTFVLIAAWIIWHLLQSRMESKIYDEEKGKYGDIDTMTNLLTGRIFKP